MNTNQRLRGLRWGLIGLLAVTGISVTVGIATAGDDVHGTTALRQRITDVIVDNGVCEAIHVATAATDADYADVETLVVKQIVQAGELTTAQEGLVADVVRDECR